MDHSLDISTFRHRAMLELYPILLKVPYRLRNLPLFAAFIGPFAHVPLYIILYMFQLQ